MPENQPLNHSHVDPSYQRWVKRLDLAAEVSNLSVVIEIVLKILGAFFSVALVNVLSWIEFSLYPMIYLFRTLARLTRMLGREFLPEGMVPDEHEEFGEYTGKQFKYDIA